MTVPEERLEMIRANAELVVREMADLAGTDHGYSAEGVSWVEGFIERQRPGYDPRASGGLVGVLGCYLGEAIIAAVPGAEWADGENGSLGILFPTGDMAFPLTKVEKQLADGLENGESIASFYSISVNYVAAGKLGEAANGEGP
jgi:hypothetical protein